MKVIVTRKLKSKKAAALILALLFSIVAMLLCAAIVTSVLTSSGKTINSRESEEPYFLSKSLMQILKAEFYNEEGDGGMTLMADTELSSRNNECLVDDDCDTSLSYLKKDVEYCLKTALEDQKDTSTTITVKVGDAAFGEYTITMVLTVIAVDYDIILDITEVTGANGTVMGIPDMHTIRVYTNRATPMKTELGEDSNGDEIIKWISVRLEYSTPICE